MNADNIKRHDLPIKYNLALVYIASFMVGLLMAVVSIISILYREITYPTSELIRTFLANDLVNVIFGLPILFGSMWLASRGQWLGLLCWPGALVYVLYNYLAYLFAVPLNWAYLLYLLVTVLSLYSLVTLLASMDGDSIRTTLAGSVRERFAGGVLFGFGLLFLLRVVVVLLEPVMNGDELPATELAVNVVDFLISPALMMGGVLLWQRRAIGYVVGLGLLFQGSMLFIALVAFLLLQPVLTDTPFAVLDIIVVLAMGLIFFIPFVLFVRGVLESHR